MKEEKWNKERKKTLNPGTVYKRFGNSDGRTETDGRINIQADMFYDIKKKTYKSEDFFFKSTKPFSAKNPVAHWRRVGLNFRYYFINLGGYFEQNGNVKKMFYINSNCVFPKAIPIWGQVSQPAYSLAI